MNAYRYTPRQRAAVPFAVVAGLAILAGGLLAAAVAHAPTQPAVWTTAYLVLVAGMAQLGCGAGRVYLAKHPPAAGRIGLECVAFNLGNAGVIAGTLVECFPIVAVGGLLLTAALALWLRGVRGTGNRALLHAYRLLLAVVFVGAATGVTLSAVQAYA